MRLRSAPRNSISAVPDVWRSSRTAAAPFSALLPTTTTPMPGWASTRAIALPIPSVPPVTSAMRRSPDGLLLGFHHVFAWVFGLRLLLGQLRGNRQADQLGTDAPEPRRDFRIRCHRLGWPGSLIEKELAGDAVDVRRRCQIDQRSSRFLG